MIIGIDGTVLGIPFESGQRRYTHNLIFNLAKIDKKNKYIIFGPKNIQIPKNKNFHLVVWPKYFILFRRQIALPILTRLYKVDVFHYPDVWGSIVRPCSNTVVTFNDLAPSHAYPAWYESVLYFSMKLANYFVRKYTLSYATSIIIISKTIKNEYEKTYGHDARLKIIYDGISAEFKRKISKKANYFLAFTDFSPRKNIARVLEAYSIFIKKNPNTNTKLKIIISTNYPREAILKRSCRLDIEKHIEILTAVTNKDLVKLYNKSICLIYPSLYEGFGLPILEAMACGCPVITSNYGATKEIAGGAAVLVNPRNVKEIYESMLRIKKSTSLQKKYIKLGVKRSKQFSWNNTAINTLKIYNSFQ